MLKALLYLTICNHPQRTVLQWLEQRNIALTSGLPTKEIYFPNELVFSSKFQAIEAHKALNPWS